MTRFSLTVSAAAALLALAGCGGGGEAGSPEGRVRPLAADAASAPSPDVVVQLRHGASAGELAARHGLALIDQFGSRPIYRLRAAPGTNLEPLLAALRGEPELRFAEPNAQGQAPEVRRGVSVWAIGSDGQTTEVRRGVSVWAIGSNVGGYLGQWAPQAMRLAQAHAVSVGAGVRVAVLDTGADLNHPALVGQWARDSSGNVVGRDFVDDDADPSETGSRADFGFGHGTHVSGLVALAAPAARIIPVRVLDAAGGGNSWVVAEALAWALDPDGDPSTDDGAHIINLSFGSTEPTALLRTVTDLATCDFDDGDDANDDDFADAGFDGDRARCRSGQTATVFAAAGNSGDDKEMLFPAAEPVKGVLAVTASTATNGLAAFANFGGWIKTAAPGDSIVSTVPGGGYGVWSGSSMAAPLAAGTAALVLATLPPSGDASRPAMRQWLPEFLVKRVMDRTSAVCNASIRQIDAVAAVLDVQGPDALCP